MADPVVMVDIVARETVKPSRPTPEALREFKLTLMDQTAPVMYTALLLFYPADDRIARQSQHLKASLSKVLTRLYPLGGTIKDQTTIECNDEGAEFVEARVRCTLSDILKQPDSAMLRNFLPAEIESTEADSGKVLLVQANFFNCGGLVIGVCISHKIADAATLTTFVNSWATAATAEAAYPASPLFMASSIFSPILDREVPAVRLVRDKFFTKRYVFNASNLAKLKYRVASAGVQHPTRVESVTALIWKCMINVTKTNKLGFKNLSLISHSVDLRKWVEPPLPEEALGNIVGMFFAKQPVTAEEDAMDLPGLAAELRRRKREFTKNGDALLEIINVEKRTWLKMCGIVELGKGYDIDYCTFTSWCRFPIYEVDFGWGKPIWATLPNTMLKNLVVLFDSRDGEGIEALVTLSKEDMAVFESEQTLLEFAEVNPSVV